MFGPTNSLYIPEIEANVNVMNQQINLLDSMTTSHRCYFEQLYMKIH